MVDDRSGLVDLWEGSVIVGAFILKSVSKKTTHGYEKKARLILWFFPSPNIKKSVFFGVFWVFSKVL